MGFSIHLIELDPELKEAIGRDQDYARIMAQ